MTDMEGFEDLLVALLKILFLHDFYCDVLLPQPRSIRTDILEKKTGFADVLDVGKVRDFCSARPHCDASCDVASTPEEERRRDLGEEHKDLNAFASMAQFEWLQTVMDQATTGQVGQAGAAPEEDRGRATRISTSRDRAGNHGPQRRDLWQVRPGTISLATLLTRLRLTLWTGSRTSLQ